MNKQLYQKLNDGEMIQDGDVWARNFQPCGNQGKPFSDEDFYAILRPVSIERVTGTESAFPAFDGSGAVGGMTLREHYAGLALQGYMGIPDNRTWKGDTQDGPVEAWQHKLMAMDAELCVRMADALITALNKKEEVA